MLQQVLFILELLEDNMNVLPEFSLLNNIINQGEVFTINDYCKNKFCNNCKIFYRSIISTGIFQCPYGFTAISTDYSLSNNIIYTSLVLNERPKKKFKNKGYIKNIFSKDELTRLIGIIEQKDKYIQQVKEDEKNEVSIIHSVFHEIRRLSRDLDGVGSFLQKYINHDDEYINNLVNNVLQTINLIAIRIDSYELLKNPLTITSGKQPNIQIYKKFDKCRYILNARAKKNNTNIDFVNESYFSITGYEIFDLLPYIILDNAVKYTPTYEPIKVEFNDSNKTVIITSIGPKLNDDEKDSIFSKGFRGKNTLNTQGSGLGLHMLKQICDLHNITVEIKSDQNVTRLEKGHPFSRFIVKLDFSTAHN